MRNNSDQKLPVQETTLIRAQPDETTLKRDQHDERPAWSETTLMTDILMKDLPGDLEMSLMRLGHHPMTDHPDHWQQTTLMTDHPDHWQQTTLMIDHPDDDRPP